MAEEAQPGAPPVPDLLEKYLDLALLFETKAAEAKRMAAEAAAEFGALLVNCSGPFKYALNGMKYWVFRSPAGGYDVYRASRCAPATVGPKEADKVREQVASEDVVAYLATEALVPRCGYCGSEAGNDPDYRWCTDCGGV